VSQAEQAAAEAELKVQCARVRVHNESSERTLLVEERLNNANLAVSE
jgi:hypothetical protein